MMLADLTMQDVEAFNRLLVTADYSSSQVSKRLRLVKAIIDRAGATGNMEASCFHGTGCHAM